eukprot:gnl/MRDRNA2_/MRDRNA2_148060_c0_seq1.p1 gnl/MRDRNA2_/MRDRNA2_148060_c0~~gnl/MRDRNA2_/MRDRNA2_148060_c0_seq1.p1  ORF type:complete len:298 (+),score=70.98 gnl/MRDRNA2_/MRDRNA2_148060_c0_seq1:76-969(+)
MPKKLHFDDVCRNVHALFYRISYIDEILQRARDHQLVEKKKWEDRAKQLKKELKEDCDAGEDLSKRVVHMKDSSKEFVWFSSIDRDGSHGITKQELESAILSAVKRFKITSTKLLGGWTVTEFFKCMDRDGSGEVSLEEWLPVEKLKIEFRKWDTDGSGTISFEELMELMSTLNPSWTKSELDELWRLADKNNSGRLEYDEFVDVIMVYEGEELTEVGDAADVMKDQFRKWDKDNSGVISTEELSQLLRTLNPDWNAEQLDMLFKLIDKNHNGKIEYCEFVDFIHNQDDLIEEAHRV